MRLSFPRPVVLAVLLTAGLAGCSGGGSSPAGGNVASSAGPGAAPEALVGKALAKVNGAPVGSLAFDALAQRKTPADGKAFSDAEKREVLDQAVVDELLFQDAFRKGMYHDPKVRKILVNLLLRDEVYDNVRNEDFTDAQLQGYYDAHKEEFVIPEKVQVKRIFIPITPERDEAAAKKQAADLIPKIKADPESFTDLAMKNSADAFARRGGDLGFIAHDGKPGVPTEVTDRAFTMGVGDISEPFVAGGGVNLIFVPNKRERIERTFEQMRGSVLRHMKNDKFEELSKQFIDKLRAGAKIEIDEPTLAAYNPAPPSRPTLQLPGMEDGQPIPGTAPAPGATPPPGAVPVNEDDMDDNEADMKRMMEDEKAGGK